jgi:hypothetical protein
MDGAKVVFNRIELVDLRFPGYWLNAGYPPPAKPNTIKPDNTTDNTILFSIISSFL